MQNILYTYVWSYIFKQDGNYDYIKKIREYTFTKKYFTLTMSMIILVSFPILHRKRRKINTVILVFTLIQVSPNCWYFPSTIIIFSTSDDSTCVVAGAGRIPTYQLLNVSFLCFPSHIKRIPAMFPLLCTLKYSMYCL